MSSGIVFCFIITNLIDIVLCECCIYIYRKVNKKTIFKLKVIGGHMIHDNIDWREKGAQFRLWPATEPRAEL